MSLNIRLSRAEDAPLLPAVERSAAQAFACHPGLEWIAEGPLLSSAEHMAFITSNQEWVVVDQQDEPQGFICTKAMGHNLHIVELSVAQAYQGLGYGRRLIAAVGDWAGTQGFVALTLTTFTDVPWNAPFYARLGFTRLADSDLDGALAQLLEVEVTQHSSARCAMSLALR
ncbi:GNAT family N-acetyltransferase [Pseudomonas wadenswilerensis]|uniref:GNAT family N-acetyltransferase n=1 Tax=Pseudomonas TaxID=286 RepID=UPI00100CECB6|nr:MULTISPECIES: GNAT family N-acetyltransferase [unclassified Pseudomonas]MCE5984761.1 GNAT family N-acetyltransferase [Pseudomonas sp. LF19]SPO69099.1 Acetyltransferase [Pseudomonas sp. JV241A]